LCQAIALILGFNLSYFGFLLSRFCARKVPKAYRQNYCCYF